MAARREWQCPECGLIFRSRYQPEECPGCGEPLADLDEFDLLVDLEEEEDEDWLEDDLDEDEDLLPDDEILDEDEVYEDDLLGEDLDDEELAADLDLLDEADAEEDV